MRLHGLLTRTTRPTNVPLQPLNRCYSKTNGISSRNVIFDYPKYLPDNRRRRRGRILADLLFFIGDGDEQAVERPARDVVLQVRVLFLHQAELRRSEERRVGKECRS